MCARRVLPRTHAPQHCRKKALRKHAAPGLLVSFYAPWCAHCKTLAPEYTIAAAALAVADPPVRLAKVDCTREKKLGRTYAPNGYPALLFFRGNPDGKGKGEGVAPLEFPGLPNRTTIVAWVRRQTGGGCNTLPDEAAVQAWSADAATAAKAVFVLGVGLQPAEAHALQEAVASWDDAACALVPTQELALSAAPDRVLELDVGAVSTAREALGRASNGDKSGALLLWNVDGLGDSDGAAKRRKLGVMGVAALGAGLDDSERVRRWKFAQQVPEVVIFGESDTVAKALMERAKTHLLLFTVAEGDKEAEVATAAFHAAAKEHRGRFCSVLVPATEAGMVGYFGLSPAMLPAVRMLNISNSGDAAHKKMGGPDATAGNVAGAVNAASIKELVHSVMAGEAAATIKSAPEPPVATAGQPRVIVGSTFAREVLRNSAQDVFVQFHAPWCEHCKAVTPAWTALAKRLSGARTLAIATVNLEENELPPHTVPTDALEALPAMLLFRADGKGAPRSYDVWSVTHNKGARDVAGFVRFLRENAAQPFDDPGGMRSNEENDKDEL